MNQLTLTEILGREKVRELAEDACWVTLYGVPVGRMSPDERLALIGWMDKHGWPWGRTPLIDFLPVAEERA